MQHPITKPFDEALRSVTQHLRFGVAASPPGTMLAIRCRLPEVDPLDLAAAVAEYKEITRG